jgi:hypothetical protein
MIDMKVKELFLDRKAVSDLMGNAWVKAYSKFGAHVRTKAQRSLRYTKLKHSSPGEPPRVHRAGDFMRQSKNGTLRATSPLRELIFFSLDMATKSVVIGPTPFRGPAVVPGLLEYGGVIAQRKNYRRTVRKLGSGGEIRIGMKPGKRNKTTKKNKDGKWVSYATLKTAAQVERANRLNEELYGPMTMPPAKMAARPYMNPAFNTELNQLAAAFGPR